MISRNGQVVKAARRETDLLHVLTAPPRPDRHRIFTDVSPNLLRDLLGVATRSRLRLMGITDIGQKRHLARSFDRDRHLLLVFPTGARVATALNLAPLGDKAAELRDVLVISCRDLFPAEEAGPPAPIQDLPVLPGTRRRGRCIPVFAPLRSCSHRLPPRDGIPGVRPPPSSKPGRSVAASLRSAGPSPSRRLPLSQADVFTEGLTSETPSIAFQKWSKRTRRESGFRADHFAGGGEHVPEAAVQVQCLAFGLAWGCVGDVRV